jgi:hypothetical protein
MTSKTYANRPIASRRGSHRSFRNSSDILQSTKVRNALRLIALVLQNVLLLGVYERPNFHSQVFDEMSCCGDMIPGNRDAPYGVCESAHDRVLLTPFTRRDRMDERSDQRRSWDLFFRLDWPGGPFSLNGQIFVSLSKGLLCLDRTLAT